MFEIKGLPGIKGLSARERASLKLKYREDLDTFRNEEGYQKGDSDYFIFDAAFYEKFKNREDYNSLNDLDYTEKINFWNNNYEMKEDLTPYTVEHGDYEGNVREGALPYNPETGLPKDSIDNLFTYSLSLSDARKKVVDDNLENIDFNADSILNKKEEYKDFDEKLYKEDPKYYYQVDQYSKEIRSMFDDEENSDVTYAAFKKFDNIASKISPAYKNFKNTDRLALTPGDVKDIMAQYYAISDLTNEEEANQFLQDYIQNRVAENQTISEKYKNAFKGIGASAMGSTIATAGFLDAVFSDAWDTSDYNEDLSNWSNFWNKAFNNELTRYGSDIITYQSFNKDEIERLRASGIAGNIFRTVEEERGDLGDKIFNVNFLPTMIQQHGFTVASSGISFGTGILSKAVGKYIGMNVADEIVKYGIIAGKADEALRLANKTEKYIDLVFDKIGGFLGAGLAGTGESVINGLEQYNNTFTEGEKLIFEDFNKWATPQLESYRDKLLSDLRDESFNRMSKEGVAPMTNEEYNSKYKQAMQAYMQELQEAYKETMIDRYRQLEVEAVQAQNTRAVIDQINTGFLNATLKSTIMHPSVKRTFGKIVKDNPYGIDEVAEEVVDLTKGQVAAKLAWGTLKESFGEGIEEAVSEIGGGIAQGWHGSDFEKYMTNGYGVIGEDAVHNTWGASMIGALAGLGHSLTDVNTYYSFISGAFSSGISVGNPVSLYNTVQTLRDPNASASDKWLSAMSTIVRSSWVEGYMNTKRELDQFKRDAKSNLLFMKDPKNTETHTNVVRMANFSSTKNMSTDNELNYRSSQLGEAVAEITTLESMRDQTPSFYNKTLDRLENLASGIISEQDIEEYRNAKIADENVSDEIIKDDITKNAKEFLKLREKVLQQEKQIRRLYGEDMDSELVNAMVYGEIAYDDYESRKQTMTQEVNESFKQGQDSTTTLHKRSTLNEAQKKHVAKYGNISTSEKEIKDLESSIEEGKEHLKYLKEKVKRIKDSKSKQELEMLVTFAEIKLKNEQQRLKGINKSLKKSGLKEVENSVLSEEDIMEMNPSDRAQVMSQRFYDKASEEQKEVIDNLRKILKNGDAKTGSSSSNIKINDISKLQDAQEKHHQIRSASRKDLTEFGKTVRRKALERQSKTRLEALGRIRSYKEFEEAFEIAISNEDTGKTDYTNASTILKDNENYKKWKATNNLRGRYDNALNIEFKKEDSITKEEVLANRVIGRLLADQGIDPTNVEAITETLLGPDLSLDIQGFYSTISKDIKDAPILTFDDALIGRFIERIKSFNGQLRRTESLQEPVIVDNNADDHQVPPPPVVEVTEEDKQEIEKEFALFEEEELKSISIDDFIEKAISEVYNTLTDEGDRVKFGNMLCALTSYKDAEEDAQLFMKSTLNSLISKRDFNPSIKTKAEIIKNADYPFLDKAFLTAEVEKLSNVNDKSFIHTEEGKTLYNGVDVTEAARRIRVLQSRERHKNNTSEYTGTPIISETYEDEDREIVLEAYNKHNVLNWLKDNKSDHKADVFFVVATDIIDIAQPDYAPVYMVIESEDGTIEIDGKKYQVIGISTIKGPSTLGEIQEMAVKQTPTDTEETKKFRFVNQYLGTTKSAFSNKPVVMHGYRIKNTAPKHLQVNESGGSNKIKDLLGKLSVKDFIGHMTEGSITTDDDGITTVEYISPDGKTVTPPPIASQKGKNRKYLSFVEKTGKSDKGPYNGETEIEIFVDTLDKITLPNGMSFIDFLNSGDVEHLFNPNKVGYALYSYASTLEGSILDIIERYKDPNSIAKNIGKDRSGFITFLNTQELTSEIAQLAERLGRYLNLQSTYNFTPYFETQPNDILIVGLKIVDSSGKDVGKLNIGAYGPNESGDVMFYPNDNLHLSIKNFMKDSILNEDKSGMRMEKGYPVFKYQIAYNDIVQAREGTLMESAPDKNALQEDKFKWASFKRIEEAINLGVLYVSKESLNRSGYHVEVNDGYLDDSQKRVIPQQPEPLSPPREDSPVELQEVKKSPIAKALDLLVEKYKELKEKLNNGGEREGVRVTSRNYTSKGKIDPIVEAVGNLYDSAIRDIINNNFNEDALLDKYPNLNREEASKLVNVVLQIKDVLATYPGNWTLDAREVLLSGELSEKSGGFITEEGKNGKKELVSGTPDIIAYNDQNQIIIIDIKTYSSSTVKIVEEAKVGWKGQTDDYKELAEMNTGGNVIATYILPIKVDYSKNVTVTADGTMMDGIMPAAITSTFNSMEDSLLLQLTGDKKQEEEKKTELEKEQERTCGIKGNKSSNNDTLPDDKLFDFD